MRISDWSSDVCSSDLLPQSTALCRVCDFQTCVGRHDSIFFTANEHGAGIRTGDYLVPGLNFLTADGWLAAALMADSDTGGRFRNRPLNRACKGRSGDCRHPHQTEFYPMHGNPPQMRARPWARTRNLRE